MPKYTALHQHGSPAPIFISRAIDDIANLKVGDYFVQQRNFTQEDGHPTPIHGQTEAWNITRITKKCVYIESARYDGTYQQVRLMWKTINPQENPNSPYLGYLNNDSYQLYFHEYVKQEDMTLELFFRNRELQDA